MKKASLSLTELRKKKEQELDIKKKQRSELCELTCLAHLQDLSLCRHFSDLCSNLERLMSEKVQAMYITVRIIYFAELLYHFIVWFQSWH
jgi:hypothetical protein